MSGGGGKVVLVTGVSRDLGRRCARAIAEDPSVRRVIGVDVVPPRGDVGGVSFVRADIRNPVIAKIIAKEDVDTVVHMSVIATPGTAGGRSTMKELNVIGTMQLLAACQKAPSVRDLVVKSTTTVYGASNRDPAMFTEGMEPRRAPRAGYAKDVAEIEGYVRGFARRRTDVRVTMLRCANVIGPHVVSPITSYFRLPVVPTVLGYDARMQFLHEDDLQAVLQHAVSTDVAGTFNVAGDGVLMLSQAVRRLQRPAVPLPGFAVGSLGSALRSARVADFSPEQQSFLTYGRGVDTTAMHEVLGFRPRYTTAEAFADFASGLPPTGGRAERALAGVAERLPSTPAYAAPSALPGAPGAVGGDDSTVLSLAAARTPARSARAHRGQGGGRRG
ncbi:NAD-dependent epimerase/dehydratase family protein [Nocardioides litoris]|uniref:NAD-dependent epimerase/dehydratase family protein n=1 Tax=Nocardioides litoris TaxID=1926648 RepID=UPI0011218217|nr:NAD-dependent epimerase/dehydratase family protein [Nocardioides litoris]